MTGNGMRNEVTPAQRRAIAALLLEPNIGKAAERAAVGDRTLRRWLADDDAFRAALRTAQDQAVDAAVSRLAGASGDAADVLAGIAGAEGEKSAVRVSAARAVLDCALKLIELRDLSARVQKLEERIER